MDPNNSLVIFAVFFKGETLEEEAKIYQFVEWSLRFGPDLQGDQAATALKELNSFLENRVYLTQHRLTLADVVAFYTVHSLIVNIMNFSADVCSRLCFQFCSICNLSYKRVSEQNFK